jgi:hypothetical protein
MITGTMQIYGFVQKLTDAMQATNKHYGANRLRSVQFLRFSFDYFVSDLQVKPLR